MPRGAPTRSPTLPLRAGRRAPLGGEAAADWLSNRIDPLRVKVAELDAQADALRAQSGLLTGANGMTTPTQRLAELTTQIAAARAAQSAAHAKAQALSDMINGGRLEAFPKRRATNRCAATSKSASR